MTRSVLGGEIYAFADAFDYAYTMKHDLENITGRTVPLKMFTDSKSLFDIITKSFSTTERRIMIDVQAVRNGYDKREISDIGFIRPHSNPADAFTKVGPCAILDQILASREIKHNVEQWIIGTPTIDITSRSKN